MQMQVQIDPKQLLAVLTAVKNGDFTARMPSDEAGVPGKVNDTLNDIVELLGDLLGELGRINKVVAKDGKITQRASLKSGRGGWAIAIDTLNEIIGDIVQPTTEVARVIGSVARGDLSQSMALEVEGRPLKGEFMRTAKVVNTMVSQLDTFAQEVTRVAREVGIEGKLGGQAKVRGVAGTWKDLTDNVNLMASNLTAQVRNIADVTTAVAKGDLSRKVTVVVEGEILELKNTVNTMVDQLGAFAAEVTRVAREVGTEGKLGGQAQVRGVSGTWKDLTENVNMMASNLTAQVRNIADVTTAVAKGDLSRKITVDVKGEILELKITINTMVDQLGAFAAEVTRVAREVGTDGKLGGQAEVLGVSGTWKDLTDNVNFMAGNLTSQVRNIADVTTAVAKGDLSRKITVDVKGEILELKNTINTMVDQLSAFASEVTRVAREVGTDGKLGGQAEVLGVSGTWKDLTDNVNFMAGNLTGQVRNIADVTTAVAKGDLSRKITVDVKGEMLELKNTINTMVDQLSGFASEVTRVAREVGTDGKLGGQAEVLGVSGTWKDLTDSVNRMAGNLTGQVRAIADVTTAVANGDLSRKITVDVRGEILELKNTINTMVDQLGSFAAEVTRVAREVGTEGKLGGQAQVKGVAGTWKDLTDNVNFMAGNLTGQVRNIADVTTAVAKGDLSRKITVDVKGEMLELKNTINTMVDQLSGFASEVTRVAREVGTDGKLGGQAEVLGVSGTWKDLTDSVNRMAGNLTGQVRAIADVTTAVANGDLSKKISVDVRGEILELKNTINTMVDQLGSFAAEVTRVAREVGTEGKLGGQAQVKGVAGTWKDLTDNVNFMAGNLTGQVRNIAAVTTAVANGDLSKKITVDVKGELLELKITVNTMVDQLGAFAAEVTRVAREVGTDGSLGGQAMVQGVSGTWKDLTDSVNLLAANLTTQVRAIAEVATSVAEGDLTRSIAVEARGEVEALKVNINQMIANLRDTTQKNTAQDWLKTNLTRFTRMLQGHRELGAVAQLILRELAPLVNFQQAAFYLLQGEPEGDQNLQLIASWAYRERKHLANRFRAGEGLVGQCVLEKQRILLTQVPADYIKVGSGLGETDARSVVVIPVLFEGDVKAVIELATLYVFSEIHIAFLDQLTESIGIVLNTIAATMRTEDLLVQSQSLARELGLQQAELTETNRRLEEQARTLQASEERLKSQQEELQQTNEELEERSELLQMQNAEVERKNREIELAKLTLEERAQQLSVSSKYKSEFLANMSHELRTPLNSLLLLARMLGDNPEGNLSGKQVEFARTIHSAGIDLLSLINDILDLSKIESGAMQLEIDAVDLSEVETFCSRTFAPLAQAKALAFSVTRDPDAPTELTTDLRRLQQILKNLLANAIKFTERGSVSMTIELDRRPEAPPGSFAFVVVDTGIGIDPSKHALIFEAFQQADGTTSRRFGGTGLGLNISREIATLLGGEIQVTSGIGKGSTFTLYLPARFEGVGNGSVRAIRRAGGTWATAPIAIPPIREATVERESDEIADDRDSLDKNDRVLMIVEDDPDFAKLMLDMARERAFKGVVAPSGERALALARKVRPDAITIDIGLPGIDGWAVLDRLKHDPHTRHVPVHLISARDDESARALEQGAISFLAKPMEPEALRATIKSLRDFVDRSDRRILIIEDDEIQRTAIAEVIGNGDVEVEMCTSGADALARLRQQRYDCVVMDLGLPDMSGFELLDRIVADTAIARPPIVVYTARELTPDEDTRLARFADSIIIKSARSLEHLLDETALFLHRVESELPQWKQRIIKQIHGKPFVDKHVLLVDDDVRNIFALTSVLELHGMRVSFAENGKQALDVLAKHDDIALVLLDVMMPEMDGYETMARIRGDVGLVSLPIIALTAKAMKGDREKCIAAGASDYITKPVDVDQLLSLMRVWLYRD